jgi:hypothetical protein
MRWRNTNYNVQTEKGDDNPSEYFAPDGSHIDEVINVIPGTVAARLQAYVDFIGGPSLQTVAGGAQAGARYVSRITPKFYDSYTNQTGQYFLWCTGLTNARPYGVASIPTLVNPLVPNLGAFPTIPVSGQSLPFSTQAQQARMVANYQALMYFITADGFPGPDPFGAGGTQINPNSFSLPTATTANPLGGLPDEGYWLGQGWANSRYIVKEIESDGGWVTTRPAMMAIATGNGPGAVDPCPAGFPIWEAKLRVRYTWMQVPIGAVPFNAISIAQGRINAVPFDGFPANCCLVGLPKYRIYNSPFGNKIVDVTYPITVKYNVCFGFSPSPFSPFPIPAGTPLGWNTVLHVPSTGSPNAGKLDYYPVGAAGTTGGEKPKPTVNQVPYRYCDITTLFRPDQPFAGYPPYSKT